ncbi:MAG: HAMP domain-containing sensor histidine kinase [Solirubrobacteraceae bacterium]
MNIATRLNSRITRFTVGRGVPHRTARVRLTLLYGGLFLLSGAALMAIAYALLVNAGFVFTLQNNVVSKMLTQRSPLTLAPPAGRTANVVRTGPPPGFPGPGSRTHPSAKTMAHWREVAQCMRSHGVSGFPHPATSVPSNLAGIGVVSDRDGVILAFPSTINQQSSAFVKANTACGFMVPDRSTLTVEDHRRTQVAQELVIQSGIALAGMSLISLVLGWLMAGRVLAPLESSYEAQRQFVANASHELRTPLTLERAIVEVTLADPRASNETLRAMGERVLQIGEQQERMIDALLALARSERGLERREQFDLSRLAGEVIAARNPQIASCGVRLESDLRGAPMSGDVSLAERLLANLIDNAARHNVGDGWVSVTTATTKGRAILTVSNSGPVVPEEDVERLFRPFQRIGAARASHGEGHGLGLSIVSAIAAAHGAEVQARARPEGGLHISVSFTAAAQPSEPDGAPAAASSASVI